MIELCEGSETDFIKTKIPFRGMAANLPISAILLANDIISRIPDSIKHYSFERVLSHFVLEMYGLKKFDLTALKRIESVNN